MSEVNNPLNGPTSDREPLESLIGRFEEAWEQGQRPAIDDFLPAGDVTALAELIHVDLERRLKAGEAVRVETYLERYPVLADHSPTLLELINAEYELRRRREPDLQPDEYARRFPQLQSQLTPDPTQTGPAGAARSPVPGESGPRYRPLHFHARGGLGEVHVAQDEEFGRQVALKRIREDQADDPESRRRFLLEAQITGRLEHPGVVPAYSLTWDEAGRPSYAMRFIQGESLRDAIQRFHEADSPGRDVGERGLELRQLLQRFIAVCNTIAYAHSRGVLHRDIKPANIMLGKYGETLVVDWGLARATGKDDAALPGNGNALAPTPGGGTWTGLALGTPAYMSPEQARGDWDRVGPASDVYSLGATLYCLLTGQGPFQGKAEEVLVQVRRGEVLPPRHWKPQVPRPLEAVCLKAMAHAPQERYATALELAADVEHWLADEPVCAYREPLPARLGRWRRRHRALVMAVAAALVVAALLTGGVWWWRTEAGAERERLVHDDLHQARQLRAEAEKARPGDLDRWTRALAAAKRAEGRLADEEDDDPLRQEVRALVGELEQEAGDRRMIATLEEVRLKQAQTRGRRFADETADPAYAAAFRRYGIDVQKLPVEEAAARIRARPIREQLAAALDDWVLMLRRLRAGEGRWRRLLRVARRADPDRWRNRFRQEMVRPGVQGLKELARSAEVSRLPAPTLVLVGGSLFEKGARAEGIALLRKAQRQYRGDFWINHQLALYLDVLNRPAEAVPFYLVAVALRGASPGVHLNLGVALMNQGQLDEAGAAFRQALRLDPSYAPAHANLGAVLFEQGDWRRAVAAFRRALRLDPTLFEAHHNLGNAYLKVDRLDDTIAACRTAIRLNSRYYPAYNTLGTALHKKGRLDDAAAVLRQCIALAPGYAQAHHNLGLTLHQKRDWDGAIASFERALRLEKDNAKTRYSLGNSLRMKGRLDEAVTAFRAALRQMPNESNFHYALGLTFKAKGEVDRAIAEYREAIRLKKDHDKAHYSLGVELQARGDLDGASAAYREAVRANKDYAEAHFALGNALGRKGDQDGAIHHFKEAIRCKQDYAEAHSNLGFLLGTRRQVDASMAAFRQALRFRPDYAEPHIGLGLALQIKGRFKEALVFLERGHELGKKDPRFKLPAERILALCRHLVKLEDRLPAILRGEVKPASVVEQVQLAEMCQQHKKLYAAAARLLGEALAARPDLAADPGQPHRYNAACAAALAGCGRGADAGQVDAPSRARWRKQALAWLRADLDLWTRQLEQKASLGGGPLQRALRHWQEDADLAGVRDAAGLAQLPEAERQEWRKFWADVQALRNRAGGK
jgi:serine/threonine-protein kinase